MPKIGLFAKDIGWTKIPVAVLTAIWLFLFFINAFDKNDEVETTYMVLLIMLGLLYAPLFYRPGQGYLGNLLKVEFLISTSAVFNVLMIKVFFPSHDFLGFFTNDLVGGPGILTIWLFASFLLVPLLLAAAWSHKRRNQQYAEAMAFLKAAKVGAVISAVEEETGQPVSPELAKKIRSLS